MTVPPRPSGSLALRLLTEGIPPSLLIDLLDPEGMKLALSSELLASDVAKAPAPRRHVGTVRGHRSVRSA